MRLFLITIYAASILAGIILFWLFSYPKVESGYNPSQMYSVLLNLFPLLFGFYGLYGEVSLQRMKRRTGSTSYADTSYYIKKKGILGKIILFPFIHIKSKYSFIVAFFGSLTWIIILMIAYFGIINKLMAR
jgi:hypothetical protein